MPRFHPSARFLNYRRTYFPNFAETIRNEEQFKISVTVPYLESLSYQRADIEFERRIDVQIGTRTHSVQADIVINIEGCPFVVIDTKTPSERVTETNVLQALSYAKLISTPPAAVGIAINGYECSGVNVITGARLNDVPTRDEASELFRLHRPRPLSEIVLQETKRILNTIDYPCPASTCSLNVLDPRLALGSVAWSIREGVGWLGFWILRRGSGRRSGASNTWPGFAGPAVLCVRAAAGGWLGG
jgi:hypothetical protein